MSASCTLTPVEHELMEILWSIQFGTVRDVMAKLPNHRQLAYTSVSTILRILQSKKILTVEKQGKQHIYKPLLSKESFASHSIHKMVQQVFSGDAVNLVAYLVNRQSLSVQEIEAIQQLLENKKKEIHS